MYGSYVTTCKLNKLYSFLRHTQLLDGPYSVSNLKSLQHVIHGMVYGLTYEFNVSSALRFFYYTIITLSQNCPSVQVTVTVFRERLQLSIMNRTC